jgi:predicted RNase H-like HicB family nuclease
MKLYRLPLVMYEPSETTEHKYMGEIPTLPGCRAWGDSIEEALENLQSLAAAFIESYLDSGDPLPPEVEAARLEAVGPCVFSEVLVAV